MCFFSGVAVQLDSCYQTDIEEPTNFYNYTYTNDDNCFLDEANGYEFEDGYGYVMTESFPFVPPGRMGRRGPVCGFSV